MTSGIPSLSVSRKSPSRSSIHGSTSSPACFQCSLALAALLGSFSVAMTLPVTAAPVAALASATFSPTASAKYTVDTPKEVPASTMLRAPVDLARRYMNWHLSASRLTNLSRMWLSAEADHPAPQR